MGKRLLDILCSAAGLLLLSPLFLIIALVIRCESPGPAFFRQERVGRHFRNFRIFKFRTMRHESQEDVPPITGANDPRVTPFGSFLRRTKLDELPQLINVLRGEMSLVGPRPEVPRYVEMFRREYEALLAVRPGITDPASLAFAGEEDLLPPTPDREKIYLERILPEKIRLSSAYVRNPSLARDIALIIRTVIRSA